ncbi:hypothetical protein KAI87_08200 [Myxococcota bacterium]|nr:hypothetical protein [Myxococcota bacterium]
MTPEDGYNKLFKDPIEDAKKLLDAVKGISCALEHTELDTLREAHILIRDYFLLITDPDSPAHGTIAEQRVVGAMWAEFEVAIDERGAKQKTAPLIKEEGCSPENVL